MNIKRNFLLFLLTGVMLFSTFYNNSLADSNQEKNNLNVDNEEIIIKDKIILPNEHKEVLALSEELLQKKQIKHLNNNLSLGSFRKKDGYEIRPSKLGEAKLYDYMKLEIKKIANGQKDTSTFELPWDYLVDIMDKSALPEQEKTGQLAGYYRYKITLEQYKKRNPRYKGNTFTTQIANNLINQKVEELNRILEEQDLVEKIFRIFNYEVFNNPNDLYWYNYNFGTGGFISTANRISYRENAVYVYVKYTRNFSLDLTREFLERIDPRTRVNYINKSKLRSVQYAIDRANQVIEDNKNKSDYDKIIAYRDYICANNLYNYEAYRNEKAVMLREYMNPWNILYVFDGNVNTNVVCEGYSKAFQYLVNNSEFKDKTINAYIVKGGLSENQDTGHMWNILTIGGHNYLVDITNVEDDVVEDYNGGFNGSRISGGSEPGTPGRLMLRGYKTKRQKNFTNTFINEDTREETTKTVRKTQYVFDGIYGMKINYAYDDDTLDVYGNNLSILNISNKDYLINTIEEKILNIENVIKTLTPMNSNQTVADFDTTKKVIEKTKLNKFKALLYTYKEDIKAYNNKFDENTYNIVYNDFKSIDERIFYFKKLIKNGTKINSQDAIKDENEKDDLVFRIQGISRYHTAVKSSQVAFDKSDKVILASGENFPDALVAGPLGKALKAPILLTPKNYVFSFIQTEIDRLGVKEVYIIGSEAAISKSVERIINNKGIKTKRISGKSRYQTSIEVAKEVEKVFGKTSNVIIARGDNFADAVVAGPYASKLNTPIILTNPSFVFGDTKKYLETKNIKKVEILGSNKAVSYNVEKTLKKYTSNILRIAGDSRYSTAIEVAKKLTYNIDSVIVTVGTNYPDALVASNLTNSGMLKAAIVTVSKNKIFDITKEFLQNNSRKIKKAYIFGSEKAINKELDDKISDLIEQN